MAQVVIENPIINSPFEEPKRHFKFGTDGITDEIIEERRKSAYFVPIARPRSRGKNTPELFDTEWTEERREENKFINQVRDAVKQWRDIRYPGVTKTSLRLLEYWKNPERERKLFFCQIEALETAIYLNEVAKKAGHAWIDNELRRFNEEANPILFRIAFKMATGSGKTVVMGMLMAYHVLNKQADPHDARFSDSFLIVTPGITIKDRLRVLWPNDPENYYRQRDILPHDLFDQLHKAKIVITNFHAFKPRELQQAGKLTKDILTKGGSSPFTETPDQMVRRVCRELGTKKNLIVINDEAHHCYRRKLAEEEDKLTGEDRKEAERREEEARIWISGLEAVQNKIGVKTTYDLSATPFFLKGSGYSEGTLFPWVVSDFSLIDAIESGIVKIPRVPVADDTMSGDQPTYRNLWLKIREQLPCRGRGTENLTGNPKLPPELEGALLSLYGNYEKYYRLWEGNEEGRAKGMTPPVFIVVANNTNVSKMIFDFVSGWTKKLSDGTEVAVEGRLPIFSNVDRDQWLARPNTILIDSEQLESGESMSADFKKIASREIEEFKAEYRQRFPDRDVDALMDEDLLREVMNTVGKKGKLGENIKCVVSVSMLTEGWDANTVTHILGVRAFGTQLLCEQVVGRGLRRRSYAVNNEDKFDPEYAEVYGVPFSFIPCSGSTTQPKPPVIPTRVRALPERVDCETTFPHVIGYRWEMPSERLTATFNEKSKMVISTSQVPSKVQVDPIVGESTIHTLDGLKDKREQEVIFVLAKRVMEQSFQDDAGAVKHWLFPQLVQITRRWIKECVILHDNAVIQRLLFSDNSYEAADKIYRAIVQSHEGPKRLRAILRPYDTLGSTRYVDFDTTKPTYSTQKDKCHISHVVADTDSWEQKVAQSLEDMNEVAFYVKNHNLGFSIPYTLDGIERNYQPDFIVKVDDGKGKADLLNLIVEVSGEKLKEKAAKVSTAQDLWIPAVNNNGGYGRWAFMELYDPWNTQNTIRAFMAKQKERVAS